MAEGEPFVIRRIGVAIRADVLAVGAAAVEIQAVVADVREYAVEHHAHAQRLGLFAQARQRLLVAEHRIDPAIVARVVFVVGARAENRVEVQHAHAELLEVRQLLPHALQIAAEEIVGKVVAVFGDVEEGHFIPILVQDDILPVLGVHERVRAFAMAEAIHHDLIHDAIAHPRGSIVGRVVNGELEALLAPHHALATAGVIPRRAEHHMLALVFALEPIPEQPGLIAHADLRLIDHSAVLQSQRAHGITALIAIPDTQKKLNRRLFIFHRQTQPNLSARRHRALRLAIKRVEGMMLQNHALETLRLFKVLPRRSARGLSALHCNVLAQRLSSGFAPPAAVGRIRWKEFTFLFHFHCFPATSARYNILHARLERGRAAWRSEFFL